MNKRRETEVKEEEDKEEIGKGGRSSNVKREALRRGIISSSYVHTKAINLL
jgi:hypothetical protein